MVCMYGNIYVYIYIHVYLFIYICIAKHTHKSAHTYTNYTRPEHSTQRGQVDTYPKLVRSHEDCVTSLGYVSTCPLCVLCSGRTHAHTHRYTQIHIHAYTHRYTHVLKDMHLYSHICVHPTYMCTYTPRHICVHTHLDIYVYIHT